jgi:regulation of enolase protein 1 (concanavalin A-like superfamily)
VQVGVYACSPEESSFTADFDSISVASSEWMPHA